MRTSDPRVQPSLLEAAFAASSTPTCLVELATCGDGSGVPVIARANAAFVRLSGRPAETLAGADPLLLTDADSDPVTVALLRRALESGAGARAPVLGWRADGSTQWSEVTVLPVRDRDGFVVGAVVEHRDLSRELAAEARGWRGHHVDPTTGLAGRSLVEAELERLCNGATPFALLSCSLTRLDEVNTDAGVATGDDLLTVAAHRLADIVGTQGRVGRHTGASYTVILEGATRERAHALAEEIERSLAQRPLSPDHHVGIAVGCSVYPEDAREVAPLVHVAVRSREQVRRLHSSRWARARVRAGQLGR